MSNQIAFLMADASRLFRRHFDALSRDLGVTGQQWRVLVVLARNPGAKQGQIADLIEVEPITLSRMVDRLQEAGLVERHADPADRRAWCLHLTDKAIPLVDQMRVNADTILQGALIGFSDAERNSFANFIERFRENLTCAQSESSTMEPAHVRA